MGGGGGVMGLYINKLCSRVIPREWCNDFQHMSVTC